MKLKIDDKLYKYVSLRGIFTYKVIGITQYRDNEHYIVECANCNSDKCRIIIAQYEDKDFFKYIQMVSECEENAYIYHDKCESDTHFYTSKHACMKLKIEKWIRDKNDEIENFKKRIKDTENEIIKYKAQLEAIND